MLAAHFSDVFRSAKQPTPLIEKSILGLLRLCTRLMHKEDVSAEMLRCLELLLQLSPPVFDPLAKVMAESVEAMVKANAAYIGNIGGWKTVLPLLERFATHKDAFASAFETVEFVLLDKPYLTEANFGLFLNTLASLASTPCGGTPHSIQALDMLHALQHRLVMFRSRVEDQYSFSQPPVPTTNEWDEMWLPWLQTFARLALDSRSEVRDYSLICLQRALLSSSLAKLPAATWEAVFQEVVFPVMARLVESSPSLAGLDKTRLRSSGLVCKLFLQQMDKLSGLKTFDDLWLKILNFMDSFSRLDQSELLSEAVGSTPGSMQDSLRNVLVVMSSHDYFKPHGSLWQLTWAVIDKFCPSLKKEFEPLSQNGEASQ